MWHPPPPPDNESERVRVLGETGILDTPPDPRFDRITQLALRFYEADVAFLGFIGDDFEWMKSRTSTALAETIERDHSVCTLVVSVGEPVVIEDLRSDPRVRDHPIAAQLPWRFYAGAPLKIEGDLTVGTLCILRRHADRPHGFDVEPLVELAALASDMVSLTSGNRKLRVLSNTDPLTKIGNRRVFDEELDRACRRARRTGEPLSLILLDIDHFKQINDTDGHATGDRVLAALAELIRNVGRRPDDVVARIGGEEFGIILPDTDRNGATTVAERLRDALHAAKIPHPTSEFGLVTASIGLAGFQGSDSPSALVGRADAALYSAKRAGRDRVTVSIG